MTTSAVVAGYLKAAQREIDAALNDMIYRTFKVAGDGKLRPGVVYPVVEVKADHQFMIASFSNQVVFSTRVNLWPHTSERFMVTYAVDEASIEDPHWWQIMVPQTVAALTPGLEDQLLFVLTKRNLTEAPKWTAPKHFPKRRRATPAPARTPRSGNP